MLTLTNKETLATEYINPHHVVLVSGEIGNVNITLSTGVGIGHNFKGDPADIARKVKHGQRLIVEVAR